MTSRMSCPKCGKDMERWEFECGCGWRRMVVTVGVASYLVWLEGRGIYSWVAVPEGCLVSWEREGL